MSEYIELRPTSSSKKEMFTMEDLRLYLYGRKDVQLIDTTKLKKEGIKHLEIDKQPKENFWCDICNERPEECPMHAPLHSLRKLVSRSHTDSTTTIDYSSILKFPDEVGLCTSSIPGIEYGVCAKIEIISGTWIGPYEGRLVRPEEIKDEIDTEYMWEIFHDGQVSHYLDARDHSNSSWMRFIRCARDSYEQNMVIFQYHGCIYYRTIKDVRIGEELLVWYDSKYSMIFGIPVALNETGSKGVNPPKGIVTHDRSYHKRRHSDHGSCHMTKRKWTNTENNMYSTQMDKGGIGVNMVHTGEHRNREGSEENIHETQIVNSLNEKSKATSSMKNEVCSTLVKEELPTTTSEETPSLAFKYRNSMYHRGRWYSLPSKEGLYKGYKYCPKSIKGYKNHQELSLNVCSKHKQSFGTQCDQECKTLYELSNHKEEDAREGQYKCKQCCMTFRSNVALCLHTRIHGHHVSSTLMITHNNDKNV